MSERDGFEPGVPCWVQAVHPDPSAAVAFYEAIFGWETQNLMPADHPGDYFICRLRGRDVAAIVSSHGAPFPPAAVWTTHVWADDADGTASRIVEARGRVIGAPFDSPGGGRVVVVADPAGAVFCLWEPKPRAGAQLVNEPGAWSMSALTTTDAEGAKRFYGEVFGWEADTFGAGDPPVTLWRLPGYAGGEPQQPVPRDVIAAMVPPPDDADAPPSWNVDFWVANVDHAVERARELGADVIADPYDVPGTGLRQAVISDPQGAILSLTQPPGLP